MSHSPTVTVVICAYTQRRWADLNAAIDSALRQAGRPEVIVVIDHEEELLARLRRHRPDLTVIPNSQQRGLSGGRNTGTRRASGEIIAFLDDDAVADEHWLAHLLAPFSDPRVVGVGGSATPAWPGDAAPSNLPPELLWVVGCTYRGQPTRRAEVRNVMGCSMAFRREAIDRVGGFSLDTGRVGTLPLGAEETDLCIRLRQSDPTCRIVFEPASVVRHRVTDDRLTWRYLRRRSFFEGVSKSVLGRELGASDALSVERGYTLTVLPSGAVRAVVSGRPAGAAAIVLSLGAAAAGYLYGSIRRPAQSRHTSAPPSLAQTAAPGASR